MRHTGQLALFAVLSFAQLFGTAKTQTQTVPTASGPPAENAEFNWIPNEFVIVLKENARKTLESWMEGIPGHLNAEVMAKYHKIFTGAAVRVADGKEFEKIMDESEDIEMWERNGKFSVSGEASWDSEYSEPPPWGLDRIDQRALPLDYSFAPFGTGDGVKIYIVDSGIDSSHAEFGDRVKSFHSFNGIEGDCLGHGTFVAGIAAGAKYGVARKANLLDVRVFNCFGAASISIVLNGLDLIMREGEKPSVVNLSFGVFFNIQPINSAITALTDAGFVVVAAAGNFGINACFTTPASVPSAITVGATDRDDGIPPFSGFGECVDLFAPGVDITSALLLSGNESQMASGTSFSAPYVTGVAALVLEKNPDLTPSQVAQIIVNQATSGVISGLEPTKPGSPNLLLFTHPRCSRDYYKMLLQSECISDCELCSEDCSKYSYNGVCDDSGPNSWTNYCPLGTDCFDCGSRDTSICGNDCRGAGNGICEDEKGFEDCPFGSDCDDCRIRCIHEKPHYA